MVQVIQNPSWGETLGTGLSKGISDVLGMKLNQYSQKQQQQQRSSQLAPVLDMMGLPREYANLDDNTLGILIKQHQQAPQQEAYASALSQLIGGQPQPQQQPMQQPMSQQQQMMAGEQSQIPQQPVMPKARLNENQATKLAQIGLDLKKQAKAEEYQAKRLALEEKKLEHKAKEELTKSQRIEQHHSDKETKPLYDEINKNYRNAVENDKRLGRMSELIEKGKLGVPFINSGLKSIAKGIFGVGIDLTSLMTTDAQEFDKLSAQFASGAKDVFPGRVTNADLDAYMRQIPNLSQSSAGMKRIISGMKTANEAVKLRKQAMDEIILENNGLRPKNIDILIERKIGPQLDLLAKQFIEAPRIKDTFPGGILSY